MEIQSVILCQVASASESAEVKNRKGSRNGDCDWNWDWINWYIWDLGLRNVD
jgi:hypothetical protein